MTSLENSLHPFNTYTFVVRSSGTPTVLPQALPGEMTVASLATPTPAWRVEVPSAGVIEREAWSRLTQQLGTAFLAAPLLTDETGGERYPTGCISMRFQTDLPLKTLQAILEENGLTLRQRSRFVPEQCLVQPAAGVFLPEALVQAQTAAGVLTAWMECEVAFART